MRAFLRAFRPTLLIPLFLAMFATEPPALAGGPYVDSNGANVYAPPMIMYGPTQGYQVGTVPHFICDSGCGAGSTGDISTLAGQPFDVRVPTGFLPSWIDPDQNFNVSGSMSLVGPVTLGAGTAGIGSLTAGSAVIGHVINDAGSAVIGHVIADTGSTTAVTSLPATPAGTNNIGKLDSPCTSTLAFSQTASADILTSVAKIHFCEISIVSASQQGVSVVEGTGSVCATGQGLLEGGATGTMQVAANGGISAVSGIPFKVSKVTADHICIIQTGAGNVSGSISYGDY